MPMPAHLNSDEETMTPDQCFDEMAVALGLPKDTGYIDILARVKELKKMLEDLPDNIKWIPSAEAWTFSDDEGPDSP